MKRYGLNQHRNKKTGGLYYRLATGIDTTNSRDGLTVVIYCPADNENTIYVQDEGEFDRKFEVVVEDTRHKPYYEYADGCPAKMK